MYEFPEIWNGTKACLDDLEILIVIINKENLFCCGAATQRGSWPPHS
jgi:hypothetical protein